MTHLLYNLVLFLNRRAASCDANRRTNAATNPPQLLSTGINCSRLLHFINLLKKKTFLKAKEILDIFSNDFFLLKDFDDLPTGIHKVWKLLGVRLDRWIYKRSSSSSSLHQDSAEFQPWTFCIKNLEMCPFYSFPPLLEILEMKLQKKKLFNFILHFGWGVELSLEKRKCAKMWWKTFKVPKWKEKALVVVSVPLGGGDTQKLVRVKVRRGEHWNTLRLTCGSLGYSFVFLLSP